MLKIAQSDFPKVVRCLSRAVGFPVDIFQSNLTDEVHVEENGLPYKEVLRMLDYKLLYKSTHQTSNLHTADWNTCVFRRAAQILNLKALSFEDIYNVRVAYQAYEAGDMKGMVLEQRILMRTLKMCGKTISPMKLMHRIKHSMDSFDEPGRIQLYELIDLILWAHGYPEYIPVETYGHFEMEDEMFKLVDFDKLLSHHDEKLARRLDDQFLRDEWNFGRETYDKKAKFRDATVVCGEKRIQMARQQKKDYRGLKSAVGDMQKMVYCCRNGYVRERPKTAPEISAAASFHGSQQLLASRRKSAAQQNAILHKMQRILKYSDGKRPREKTFHVDLTDKPALKEYKRSETPKIVSNDELVDTAKRWERLMFDIETEEGRHELEKLVEMNHFIPGYLEKKEEAEDQQRAESSARTIKTPSKKSASPTRRPPSGDAVNALAYPVPRIPPSHGKKCDARFRGWYNIRSKRGHHYVLVSPFYQKSPKGGLYHKLARDSSSVVKNVHSQFVHRRTAPSQICQRPVTAPAVMTMAESQALLKDKTSRFGGTSSSGYASMDDNDNNDDEEEDDDSEDIEGHSEEESYNAEDENDVDLEVAHDDVRSYQVEGIENQSPGYATREVDQYSESLESVETTLSDKIKLLASFQDTPAPNLNIGRPRAKSAFTRNEAAEDAHTVQKDEEKRHTRSKSASGSCLTKLVFGEPVPVPYMDHSKPRVVSVGSIGKISLLENISEARYWEDVSQTNKPDKQDKAEHDESPSNAEDATEDVQKTNRQSQENKEQMEDKDEMPQKTTKQTSKIEDEEEDIDHLIKQEDQKRRQRIAMRSYSYMSKALAKLKQQRPREQSPKSTVGSHLTCENVHARSHKSNACQQDNQCQSEDQTYQSVDQSCQSQHQGQSRQSIGLSHQTKDQSRQSQHLNQTHQSLGKSNQSKNLSPQNKHKFRQSDYQSNQNKDTPERDNHFIDKNMSNNKKYTESLDTKSKFHNRTTVPESATTFPVEKRANSPKKTVTLIENNNTENVEKKTLHKNKYGGLLKRMGEDMTPYLRRKMLVT